MPLLCVKHIISFSSENEKNRTENLLSLNPKKTWRCETPGEKCAYVLLQLEKASIITGIDIGNDHSAFVEILVSRAGSSHQKFEEFLPMSSLMTPAESRNSTLFNRVRMFTNDKFVSDVKDKKWDQIKIVCTQPFNSHVTYGLAFVKITGKDVKATDSIQREIPLKNKNTNNNKFMIGKFKFREDSPDEAILGTGSLFARSQDDKIALKPAAAIREASVTNSHAPKQKNLLNCSKVKTINATLQDNKEIPRINRNHEALLYDEDDDYSNERLDKLLERDKIAKELEKERQAKEAQKVKLAKETQKNKPARRSLAHMNDTSGNAPKRAKKDDNATDSTNDSLNCRSEASTSKIDSKTKSTSHMIDLTKDSSSKATSSKYKPKEIMPKQQATKKQKLYKPFNKLFESVAFVLSGFENPLRSNLRTKALEMGAVYQPNWNERSTHLVCAFANTPKFQQVQGKGKIVKKNWIEDCHLQHKYIPWRRYSLVLSDLQKDESDEEIFDMKTAEDFGKTVITDHNSSMNLTTLQNSSDDRKKKLDPFDMSTEVEDETEKSKDFFNDKTFYVDESVGAVATMKLKNLINLLGGTVEEVLTSDIDYNITVNKNYNVSGVQSIKPEWIYECNDMEMFLPINRYIL